MKRSCAALLLLGALSIGAAESRDAPLELRGQWRSDEHHASGTWTASVWRESGDRFSAIVSAAGTTFRATGRRFAKGIAVRVLGPSGPIAEFAGDLAGGEVVGVFETPLGVGSDRGAITWSLELPDGRALDARDTLAEWRSLGTK